MQERITLEKQDFQERIERVIKEVYGEFYREHQVDEDLPLNDPYQLGKMQNRV